MTLDDLRLITPLVIVAGTILVLMIAASIRRSHRAAIALTLAGLALAFAALFRPAIGPVGALLVVDDYTRVYGGLVIVATAIVALLSYDYLARRPEQREEFYILLLLAGLGSLILVASVHFVALFLGLELLSVSLYALIAYERKHERSIEAGIKYLVLAATSAAFLVFGMALVYAGTGTLAFAEMAGAAASIATMAGIGLIVVGFGFKLALVPLSATYDKKEGELKSTWVLMHADGAALEVRHNWPVVVSGKTLDKAVATARTATLSYLLRDLLQLPRVEPGTEMDDTPPPRAKRPKGRRSISSPRVVSAPILAVDWALSR